MNKILRSLAVLVLALAGLMGCDSEPRTVEDVNPAHVAEAKEALRDLWVGHIFWTRYVVLNNATHNPEARDAAEEEVVANARQIASTMTPFYGEAAAEELFSLLDINYGAVKEYSEATVAGNTRGRMLRLFVWRPMPTTSPCSSTTSIPTCRATRYGA